MFSRLRIISLAYQYDALNQIESEAITVLPGYPGSLPLVLSRDSDGAGNLRLLTYSDGTPFTYVPDALNRLARIENVAATLLTQTYDPRSLLDTQVFNNGTTTDYDYDSAGRIDAISIRDPLSQVLQSLDYTIDPTGSVDSILDSLAGNLDYGYDQTKQLTAVDYDDFEHPGEDTTFFYDSAGNRTSVTIGATPAIPYTPNALNQYTSVDAIPQTYDLNGNLIDDGFRSLSWDTDNQLLTASEVGTTASYAYDPFGRRIRKTVDSGGGGGDVDTWFIWSGDQLLEEHDDTGNLITRYLYGSGFAPVQVEIDSGTGLTAYAVHSDHLDTPRMLTDATGAAAWRADYLAFGEAIPAAENTVEFNIRFPGQYYDAETGLHQNRFRYYDPALGRYVSADPIGQRGGANIYSYSLNNPSNRIDVMGRDSFGFGVSGTVVVGGGGQVTGGLFTGNETPGPREDAVTNPEATVGAFVTGESAVGLMVGAGVEISYTGGPETDEIAGETTNITGCFGICVTATFDSETGALIGGALGGPGLGGMVSQGNTDALEFLTNGQNGERRPGRDPCSAE